MNYIAKKLNKKYMVKTYETNKLGKLRLISLLNFFQDIADINAEESGLGLTFCLENNFIWFGAAYELEIISLPQLGDEIEIISWHCDEKKYSAIRQFLVLDKAGNPIIKASSEWILFNTLKKRPAVIKDSLPEHSCVEEQVLKTDFLKIQTPKAIDYQKSTLSTFDDIDINQHVNNAVYVKWAQNSLPSDILDTREIKEIKINFRKECKQDQEILIDVKLEENKSIHIIKSNGIELAKVEFYF